MSDVRSTGLEDTRAVDILTTEHWSAARFRRRHAPDVHAPA